jgi:hypothetical protein
MCAATVISFELERRLDAPQLVDQRRPVHELRAREGALQLEHRLAVGTRADPDRLHVAERAGRLAEEGAAVVGLVDGDQVIGLVAPEMEEHEHPRQHVQRLAAGNDEGAGHPAVRVRALPEARQVALEAGQVLEIGRRRDEQRVDPVLLHARRELLAAGGVFGLRQMCGHVVVSLESGSPRKQAAVRSPPRS